MYLVLWGYCTRALYLKSWTGSMGTNLKLLIFPNLYPTHTQILCVFWYPEVMVLLDVVSMNKSPAFFLNSLKIFIVDFNQFGFAQVHRINLFCKNRPNFVSSAVTKGNNYEKSRSSN